MQSVPLIRGDVVPLIRGAGTLFESLATTEPLLYSFHREGTGL